MKQSLGEGVPFKVVVPSTFFFKVIIKDGVLRQVRLRGAIAQVSDFVHAIQFPEYFFEYACMVASKHFKEKDILKWTLHDLNESGFYLSCIQTEYFLKIKLQQNKHKMIPMIYFVV